MNNQHKTPLLDGLIAYQKKRVVGFDVPGHKQKKTNQALIDVFGYETLALDYNSSKALDNLANPQGIIDEAQQLAAELFHASYAFFIVNGTSLAIIAMIMSVAKKGEKIIMPRNVHKSVINALVLSGIVPIYINPQVDAELGIGLAMDVKDIQQAMTEFPDAKAILVNNPTYYGITTDLKQIVSLANQNNMKVIVDEAHGTHFYFSDQLPISAMDAGASMSSVSVHKTGGSLTQSSLLLINHDMDKNHVLSVINLLQTTSPSYLLMVSLDVARKQLALFGKKQIEKIIEMSNYARKEINAMGDYYAFSKEKANQPGFFDFDLTKLSIHTYHAGYSGIEVYETLRDEYDIQIEFGDLSNILAIVSFGDRYLDIERLLASLADIKQRRKSSLKTMILHEYIHPTTKMTPQEAYNSTKETVMIKNSINRVCGESIMAYPPGIPIISYGEVISNEVINMLEYIKANHGFLMGAKDSSFQTIQVIKENNNGIVV